MLKLKKDSVNLIASTDNDYIFTTKYDFATTGGD
jgi:hypothetical protein